MGASKLRWDIKLWRLIPRKGSTLPIFDVPARMASAIFAEPGLLELLRARKLNDRGADAFPNFGIGRNLVASNISVWINC
jgi:hypothetical protein